MTFPPNTYILLPFLWKKQKACGEILQILTHSGSGCFLKRLKSFQVETSFRVCDYRYDLENVITIPFSLRGLECKSRKSRNTWSNRQIWPWSTEWSRSKANRVLPGEHTSHSKHPLPTTQEKTAHGHHQMVNTEIRLIIFFPAKDGEALYSQQKHEQGLTVAQIMTSLLSNSDLNWKSRKNH